MMAETDQQWRANVDTEIVLLKTGLNEVKGDIGAFRDEWRKKAEEDRQSHRATRLTLPQVVTMGAALVAVTGAFIGGLMFLINTPMAALRADFSGQMQALRSDFSGQIQAGRQSSEASTAQVALAVRGQGDSVTAANTAIQSVQRDQGDIKVKLGLVEQMAKANARFIDQAQSFDAQWARHDERLKALEQTARDIAARRPPS